MLISGRGRDARRLAELDAEEREEAGHPPSDAQEEAASGSGSALLWLLDRGRKE